MLTGDTPDRAGIARQQWRARIETSQQFSNTLAAAGIARQQWRARIETLRAGSENNARPASPASNGGRGLKLGWCDSAKT